MQTAAIVDRRVLTLPVDALADAVLELDKVQSGDLWRGLLTSADVVDGEGDRALRIVVDTTRDGKRETADRIFDLSALAAAIILYCGRSGVPLPKRGAKSITLSEAGEATLTVEVALQVKRLHRSDAVASRPRGGAEGPPG